MDIKQKIDQYFRDLMQQGRFSGVVLMTQGQSQLYAEAYGYASRTWSVPNTLDMRFDTASVTKLFTTVGILQLIDQGKLSLDTKVVDFLGLEDSTLSRSATVFHFLTHSSGIGDDCEEENGEIYEDLWKSRSNYMVTSTTDFLPQFASKPANFAPGDGCRYCNCGFVMLGLLIEKITGMTYRDYVRQEIFAPFGMRDSDFYHMDRVNKNVAEGCDPLRDAQDNIVGWKKNIYAYPPVGSPDSGSHVTAADLDRFMRALNAGQFISSELTKVLLTPQVYYREDENWLVKFSFCLEFFLDKAGEVVFYQKDGINAGVSAYLRHYPQHDLNVILLSNMMSGVWAPMRWLHEHVVSGELLG